jgi:hypothetical protein
MPALSNLPDAGIYGNIQAPQAMPLQDIVNLGRTNLAFQREKTLLPSQIEQAQAQSKTAVLQADTAKLENNYKHIQSIIQDQQMLLTKPDLTANDIIEKAKSSAGQFNTPKQALDQALAGIPMNGSPSDLRAYLAMNLAKTLSAASQLEKLYPGGVLPTQLPQSYQASPATAEGGYTPTGTQGTAPAGAPSPAAAPTGVTAEQMSQPPRSDFSKPVPLSYPVRQAGQAFTALPQEEDERKMGTASKSALISRQNEIPQARRTMNEVIKKAQLIEKEANFPTAGVLGSAERNVSTLLGTEQGIRYKELSKDLANVQLDNIKATGSALSTDAGKNLSAMANGDITYPPSVLMEIARRAQADLTNIDLKATGIKKFADRFGDQNINSFNQMWSANADPKIFQLKSIFDDQNMTPEQKAKARDDLIGTDKKQLQIFNEKWNNIKKLEKTGTL